MKLFYLDLILLIFLITLLVTVIFHYLLFKKQAIKIKKSFVILIVISIILVISSYMIIHQNRKILPSPPTDPHHEQYGSILPNKTYVHVSYRISESGYSDTIVRYKLEIYNTDGEMVHSKSETKFLDVDEHVGGAEWSDSTTFYCDKGGFYSFLFSFNGSEGGWGDPGLQYLEVSSVQYVHGITSILLGIGSIILLGFSNLLNLNFTLRIKKKMGKL